MWTIQDLGEKIKINLKIYFMNISLFKNGFVVTKLIKKAKKQKFQQETWNS